MVGNKTLSRFLFLGNNDDPISVWTAINMHPLNISRNK